MVARLADEEQREGEARGGTGDPQVERLGPQPVRLGQVPGAKRRQGHGEVPGELVEPHRQSALLRSHQVHLHDDRRGPCEPLVEAQQHVREDDP